jgi:hypothetical protein
MRPFEHIPVGVCVLYQNEPMLGPFMALAHLRRPLFNTKNFLQTLLRAIKRAQFVNAHVTS